jgi:hypothetical protein
MDLHRWENPKDKLEQYVESKDRDTFDSRKIIRGEAQEVQYNNGPALIDVDWVLVRLL